MNSEVRDADPLQPSPDAGDASATWTWSYMQNVLDDALNAVHNARVRSEELTQSIGEHKRAASELEERCETLETLCSEARSEADSTEDTLARLREDYDQLQERYAQALLGAMNLEETVNRARKLEKRLRAIADAMNLLDEKTREIHDHYGPDVETNPQLVEEINFARDEALEIVRRAVEGIRSRSRA